MADTEKTSKAVTRGYSLPASMHERVSREAKRRDMSASQFVRRAINYYLREVLSETNGHSPSA